MDAILVKYHMTRLPDIGVWYFQVGESAEYVQKECEAMSEKFPSSAMPLEVLATLFINSFACKYPPLHSGLINRESHTKIEICSPYFFNIKHPGLQRQPIHNCPSRAFISGIIDFMISWWGI